jgi:twitching motility protein PilT
MATLPDLLKTLVDMDGSDLHIATGTPPQGRVHGHLQRLPLPEFTPAETKQLFYSVLTDSQKKRFEETMELDFSFGIKAINSRFRCNVFSQRGAVGAVYRLIPEKIRGTRAGLPAVLAKLAGRATSSSSPGRPAPASRRRWRRCSTRSTPSGPSTSSPSRTRSGHPQPQGCLVNQREVHSDTTTSRWPSAPPSVRMDVVLIGEMEPHSSRHASRGGPLTFATLHTNSAAQTINRIIDVFPAHQQGQIRTQLSLVLEGIVCQTLLRKASGPGRTVALEIMVPTPAIRNLIREDKIHQIYSAMQTGQEKLGMQTLNQCLTTLYLSKQITMGRRCRLAQQTRALVPGSGRRDRR